LLDEIHRLGRARNSRNCHAARAFGARPITGHYAFDHRAAVHGNNHVASGLGSRAQGAFSAGSVHAAAILLWPTVLVGFFAAMYTAFLFGQCEGRDLWQTPLLPVHLVVQALLCGAAVLALLPSALGGSQQLWIVAKVALLSTLVFHLLIVAAEFTMPHSTDNSAYAARLITHGPFRIWFWIGAVAVGGILPFLLLSLAPSDSYSGALAGVLALAGLLIFEWCFVMAGQSVPNS
jgi:formate-dependent nitrite reductase membrane component NrfD